MKGLTLEIKPLEGFGELEFGSTPDEAIRYLGEPTEEEFIEEDDDFDESMIQYFDDHGISIFYEEVDGLFLSNVETENPETILFGAKVFELTIDEVINFMKENGYSDYEIEEIDLEDNEEEKGQWLIFDDALIDFLFEEGKLSNINWGAPLDDDDDDYDDDED